VNKNKASHSKLNIKYWVVMIQKFTSMLSGSFWFTPSIMILSGAVAAYLIPLVNIASLTDILINGRIAVTDPSDAMQIVQTIASSVITITSIAFSMTIVALVMASGQFGPRLLKNFMKHRLTQFALGIFTATFVYCLVALSQLSTYSLHTANPELFVLVAMVLALVCVFVLIFFIHHVATSIRADTVVKETAVSLMHDMHKLQSQEGRIAQYDSLIDLNEFEHQACIKSESDGYIQAIESYRIADLAIQYNGLIKMHVRAGEYIIAGANVATIYGHELLPHNISIDDCLVVGVERTSLQDPLFRINQLVEMALRALSPSLNDPFTATNCIDRLASALASFKSTNLPQAIIIIDATPRVFTKDVTYSELFEDAFTQIRQNCYSHPFVLQHLLNTLLLLVESSNQATHVMKAVKVQLINIQEAVTNSHKPMCSTDENNYRRVVQAIERYV